MTETIHDTLSAKGLTPAEHVVDAGYTSADIALAARARGITLVGPLLVDTSPQARNGGYTTAAFTIDWDTEQLTCPQGAVHTSWSRCTQRGTDAIVVKFDTATCTPCPVRDKCTTATHSGRQLSLHVTLGLRDVGTTRSTGPGEGHPLVAVAVRTAAFRVHGAQRSGLGCVNSRSTGRSRVKYPR